jgi:hypothetical protein
MNNNKETKMKGTWNDIRDARERREVESAIRTSKCPLCGARVRRNALLPMWVECEKRGPNECGWAGHSGKL